MYIMVDVESNGPIPGDYSMIAIGAIIVDKNLDKTFLGYIKPISEQYIPEALAVSGFTHQQTKDFEKDASTVMLEFEKWIKENCKDKPIFISDNNGFDWQFVNWYFHHFLGRNPFGFSSQNLGSLYKGVVLDTFQNFKHLRKTKHTHNPVDDAKGNAEALLTIKEKYKIKIKF